MSNGRILLIGEGLSSLKRRLTARGVALETSRLDQLTSLTLQKSPDAVIVGGDSAAALPLLRAHAVLSEVPVVFDGRRTRSRLKSEGTARTLDELEALALSNIAARKALSLQADKLARLECVQALTRLATTGEGLPAVLVQLKARAMPLLGSLELRVLLAQGETHVVHNGVTQTPLQLAVAPGFLQALQSQAPTRLGMTDYVPGRHASVLCLSISREQPLAEDELVFAGDLLNVLALAVDQQLLRRGATGAQETLEAAYVERFRELNQANERLKALDRKKNDIVAMLSHDLRAPLNVLTGHAYLLETDPLFDKTLMPSLKAMKRTTQSILEMVESLLDANRGDGEKLLLFSRTMDVSQTVLDSVRELQVLASQKGLTLKAEAPMSLEVHGDELKIRQALQNLITNSMQHARGAKQVLVRVKLKPRPDGDVVVVEVSDDGQVANSEDILLAFERSKGLGLAIARDLIERHGGEIWAEAPRFGGALFSFTLPMRSQPKMLARSRGTQLPLLLIADRDPVIARTLQLALSGHYRVSVVRDGFEVVARAESEGADVVLMDVFLPNRDGLQVLNDLKSSPTLRSVPVMLMSSNVDTARQVKEAAVGAAWVLVKPFNVSKLLQKLDLMLNRVSGRDAETGLVDQLGFVRHLTEQTERTGSDAKGITLVIIRPQTAPADVKKLARDLRSRFRQNDVLGHVGQGVFVAMLPETPQSQAAVMLNRVVAQAQSDTGLQFDLVIEEFSDGTDAVLSRFEQLLLSGGAA